jgi:hypothetical protein
MICDTFFHGQKTYQMDRFSSARVLSMESVLSLVEFCMSGLKCPKGLYECD